ncbi:alpha/beta fold hydrolase [Loktanella sp. F6476L]|uniref:alpha/beta fold hydrolase BchO n=1 Tax=Loktanella sp. F6476L TaxID=2926405 RepID=UPI001FF5EBBD|nr:alpha/beta fold hydrolase [Loktanella sp. F6476L]
MRWPRDASNWPMREFSQHILCKPHRWHVQTAGSGPLILLIHGAGGATQSFRHLFPILATTNTVLAIDLPGQGFTQLGGQGRCGLDTMADDLLRLLHQIDAKPDLIIGHSAGAAIALRLCDLGIRPPHGVVGINAALGNFKGVAGWLFPAMAKFLAATPFTASVFCATTTAASVHKLIKGTGSNIGPEGEAFYLRLVQDTGHVGATLSMVAQWSLDPLLARLPQIDVKTTLIACANDKAVPPQTSAEAAAHMPNARVLKLPNLGHLAHEEDADQIADIILSALQS